MPANRHLFGLATIAVPIVIYGLMPHLHLLRVRLVSAAGPSGLTSAAGDAAIPPIKWENPAICRVFL